MVGYDWPTATGLKDACLYDRATGSMTGAATVEALTIIHQLESISGYIGGENIASCRFYPPWLLPVATYRSWYLCDNTANSVCNATTWFFLSKRIHSPSDLHC
jgi:hypothetical protein